MNKIQKNQVRLYSIFSINAIYNVLFFASIFFFSFHWYCLVSIFITSWLYYAVDSSVCLSLICLPSCPSIALMSKWSSWSTCLIILLLCSKSSLVSVRLPDKVWATQPYMLKVLCNLVPNLLLDFYLSFSFTSCNAWISCLHDIDPTFYLCSPPWNPCPQSPCKPGSQSALVEVLLSFKIDSYPLLSWSLLWFSLPTLLAGSSFSLLWTAVVF